MRVKVKSYTTVDNLLHDFDLEDKDDGSNTHILTLDFKKVPFADKEFIDHLSKYLCKQIHKQYILWKQDQEYDSNHDSIECTKARPIVSELIKKIKSSSNDL